MSEEIYITFGFVIFLILVQMMGYTAREVDEIIEKRKCGDFGDKRVCVYNLYVGVAMASALIIFLNWCLTHSGR